MNTKHCGMIAAIEEHCSLNHQPIPKAIASARRVPRGTAQTINRRPTGFVGLAIVVLLGFLASGCRQGAAWPGISLELSLFGVFVDVVDSPLRVGDDAVTVESVAPTQP